MPRKKKMEVLQEVTESETRQVATALARMMTQNSILDNIIGGMSQEEIAVAHGISLEEVQDIVRSLYVSQTEKHAALRSRIGMLSVMRYEWLLRTIQPYAAGYKGFDADGNVGLLPPDPRFVKLFLDIVEAENNVFKDERAIMAKTADAQTKDGFQRVEETIVTGDELYNATSVLMAAEGYIPAEYADMTGDDVLEVMKMRAANQEAMDLGEKADKLLSDAEIMAQLRERKILREEEES